MTPAGVPAAAVSGEGAPPLPPPQTGDRCQVPQEEGEEGAGGVGLPTLRKRPEVKEKGEERIETGEAEEGEVRGETLALELLIANLKDVTCLVALLRAVPPPRHHSFPQIWGSPPFPSLVKLPCTPPQQHIFCVSCQFWGTLAPFPQTSVM